MTIIKNKKAQSPGVLMVVITVLVLIAGLIAMGHLKGRLPVEVSEKNIDFITQYSMRENVLLYLDESARTTTNNVIGLLYKDSFGIGCGEQDGLMLWKNESKICVPLKREVEESFLLEFLLIFNSKLNKFNLYDFSINEYSLGDLYINHDENKLIGSPLGYQSFDDKEGYEFSISFSQKLPQSMFNHRAAEVINKINSECFQYEDINLKNEHLFDECVNNILTEINKGAQESNNANRDTHLIWQYGEQCGDELFNFVQEYNNCAHSYDNFCECQLGGNYSEYKIENNKQIDGGVIHQVTFNNQTYDLELPFDTDTEQTLPLYKSDEMLHLENNDNLHPNLPLCRLNDRTVNLCLIDGKHKLHFQAYVDDKSKPKSITSTETKLEDGRTNYTWQPSISGDVKEYLIFIAKENLPFASLESSPSAIVGREIRYGENLSYVVNAGFKAKIVPIDYSGNVGGSN